MRERQPPPPGRKPGQAARAERPSAKPAAAPASAATPSSPVLQLQRLVGNRAVGTLLQRKIDAAPLERAQASGPSARTGLPGGLRSGVERLSGQSMGDVSVHRDSPEPARVQALAYTQGTEIHLGPGQEQHLPHEAWHAAQQKSGRVQPTTQLRGVGLNDSSALEAEADRMGPAAERAGGKAPATTEAAEVSASTGTAPVQRYIGEFILDDLFGEDALKGQLRAIITPYNKRDEKVEPDFYDHVHFTQSWYNEQVGALSAIQRILDPHLHPAAGAPEPDAYICSVLRQLEQNVSAERQRLALWHLKFPPHGRSELPPLIHFIWSGRAISDFAVKNIVEWGKRAQVAKRMITVWTDPHDSNWSAKVESAFAGVKIQLRAIDEGVMDPRLWEAYQTLIKGHAYPAASDVARYSILKRFGGIYIDVDIAPGDVELSAKPPLRPTLPMMSPEIRDSRAVREELGLGPKVAVTPEHVKEVAARRMERGQHNNNFIVTHEGSSVMEAVIEEVVEELGKRKGGAQFVVENQIATAAVTGPAMMKRALFRYVKKAYPNLPEGEAMDVLTKAMQHALPLGWVTPESEAQEH